MSYRSEADILPIGPFNKGMDKLLTETEIESGYYPDAENMDLRSRSPHTIDGIKKLISVAPPDGGNLLWADTYKDSGSEVILVATDFGNIFKYVNGAYVYLRSGLATNPRFYDSTQFRNQWVIVNGIDVPLRFDGSSIIPLGSQIVAGFEADETWVGGDRNTNIVRAGVYSLAVNCSEPNTTKSVYLDKATALDLLTGLDGAPEFGVDDPFRLQVYVSDPTALNSTTALAQSFATAGGLLNLHYSTAVDNYDLAQKVVPTKNINVSKIQLRIKKTGTPNGQLTLYIQSESASLPSNTVITGGTSKAIKETTASKASAGDYIDFVFPSLPSLTSGTAYWLVLKSDRTVSTKNYIGWGYAGGSATAPRAANTFAAQSTWTSTTGAQHNYKIYGDKAAVELRFHTSANVDYFKAVVSGDFVAGWNPIDIARNDFGMTGTPVWSSIYRIEIRVTPSKATTLYFDDLILAYNLSPPPAQLVVSYAGSIYLGDCLGDRIKIVYSDVSQINYFPAINFLRVTTGTQGLEAQDRISALHVYASVIIVGKPRAVFSLSGAAGQLTLDPFTTEIGIESHRGVVEAPRAIYFPYGNSIVGLRLTAKDIISIRIHPLLEDLDYENADQIVGHRHHETHTLRWSFRRKNQTKNDLFVWHDYYADAWDSRVTAYLPRDFFSRIHEGTRKLHMIAYDQFVYICDVGETINDKPLASNFSLPWRSRQADKRGDLPKVSSWVGATLYLKGTSPGVKVYYRGANTPSEFESAFILAGTIKPTLTGTDGFVDFHIQTRYIQVKLVSDSGQFELQSPALLHHFGTDRPS